MGIDLYPVEPTADAFRFPEGHECAGKTDLTLSYNWAAWSFLISNLKLHGLDTSEFEYSNDGDIISAETCIKVADIFEKLLLSMDGDDRSWLEPHIIKWRTCGGYMQY